MASVWDGARPLPRGPGARSRVYCAISVILAMFLAVELNLGSRLRSHPSLNTPPQKDDLSLSETSGDWWRPLRDSESRRSLGSDTGGTSLRIHGWKSGDSECRGLRGGFIYPYGQGTPRRVDTGLAHQPHHEDSPPTSHLRTLTLHGTPEWGNWSTPPMENVRVRSKTYLEDKTKQPSGDPVFPLSNVEVVKTNSTLLENVASHPNGWVARQRAVDPEGYSVVINLQIRSLGVSAISYHRAKLSDVMSPLQMPGFRNVFSPLSNSTKQELDSRFKLITHLEEGPLLMRGALTAAIGANVPVVMGRAVSQKYFFGEDYLEIDVEVDTSIIAKGILKIASMFVSSVVVDMIWVIEGKTLDELPERPLCAVRLGHLDLSKAQDSLSQYTIPHRPLPLPDITPPPVPPLQDVDKDTSPEERNLGLAWAQQSNLVSGGAASGSDTANPATDRR